jgi:hypothetical protein
MPKRINATRLAEPRRRRCDCPKGRGRSGPEARARRPFTTDSLVKVPRRSAPRPFSPMRRVQQEVLLSTYVAPQEPCRILSPMTGSRAFQHDPLGHSVITGLRPSRSVVGVPHERTFGSATADPFRIFRRSACGRCGPTLPSASERAVAGLGVSHAPLSPKAEHLHVGHGRVADDRVGDMVLSGRRAITSTKIRPCSAFIGHRHRFILTCRDIGASPIESEVIVDVRSIPPRDRARC